MIVRTGEVTGSPRTRRTSPSSNRATRCTTTPTTRGARVRGTISSGASTGPPRRRQIAAALVCESAHSGPAHNTAAQCTSDARRRRRRVPVDARQHAHPHLRAHSPLDLRGAEPGSARLLAGEHAVLRDRDRRQPRLGGERSDNIFSPGTITARGKAEGRSDGSGVSYVSASSRTRSASVSRRTTSRASPSRTNTTAGRVTLL